MLLVEAVKKIIQHKLTEMMEVIILVTVEVVQLETAVMAMVETVAREW